VDEAVADGVGQGGLPDRLVPLLDGELAGDERRGALVAVLEDLKEVAPFLVLERGQGEVVEPTFRTLRTGLVGVSMPAWPSPIARPWHAAEIQ
jgi:hypothetical protein